MRMVIKTILIIALICIFSLVLTHEGKTNNRVPILTSLSSPYEKISESESVTSTNKHVDLPKEKNGIEKSNQKKGWKSEQLEYESKSLEVNYQAIDTLAQELPKRREAEEFQEELAPIKEKEKKPPTIEEKPPSERIEKLPRRREAEEIPERAPPLEVETEFIPDLFIPTPDRWRLPRYQRNIIDPYKQNVLKGDYPIFGNEIFFIFTGINDSLVEFRELPTPSGISTARANSAGFFGRNNQLFIRQNFFFRFELLKGDTAFKPVDWAIVATPAINVPTYLRVQDPREEGQHLSKLCRVPSPVNTRIQRALISNYRCKR